MREEEIQFINQLHISMHDYKDKECNVESKLQEKKKKTVIQLIYLFYAIFDLIRLKLRLIFCLTKETKIYFTHTAFIKEIDGEIEDLFYNEFLESKNCIFISYDKYNYISSIEKIKVYNIGIIIKFIQKFKLSNQITLQKECNNWTLIIPFLFRNLKGNTIFIPSYSNGVGFAICFSKYRRKYKVFEVQHGSVINYPPYSITTNLEIIDTFFYRNQISKKYLEEHILKNKKTQLLQIPNFKVTFLPKTERLEILYISSYEFSSFHPVFLNFIKKEPKNCLIKVRLHPRQRDKVHLFVNELESNNCEYVIDNNPKWYHNLPINAVIVSPFSSVIEEAVEFGLKVIIIDELGSSRFDYLINSKRCIYMENLNFETLQ